MRRFLHLLAIVLCLSTPALAQIPLGPAQGDKESLQIGASTHEIAITSDFRGADLTIFGSVDNADQLLLAIGQYDIVVTLEGPKSDATVRRKERLFGIWVNRRSMTFEQVPRSYSLSSTRAVDTIATPEELNDLAIGIDHMRLVPIGYIGDGSSLGEFRQAFRQSMQSSGLYQRDPSGVRFVSPTLFRASLRLPANIPHGVHTVRAMLFKSGEFVTEKDLKLRVIKTGIEQTITDAAHEQPVYYGFFAVLLAVITGWSASVLFRKD
ncbi:TIGR02186 family protein [Rhizobiaceae bacterium n13]|uniref:TIGR02186 family protein n=1 Tax=Ferirhizobium litorale TaxID=2927786 RepID=A0AAE3U279_9HYPH|nr:TIGR02186 family protein [Fererhizobium litorale]MDI7862289.1 TIGR02186 family protein [Fererhizobium litorale]MDI7922437.1 TIGR02186 family protein [Fererhizobium litorale]